MAPSSRKMKNSAVLVPLVLSTSSIFILFGRSSSTASSWTTSPSSSSWPSAGGARAPSQPYHQSRRLRNLVTRAAGRGGKPKQDHEDEELEHGQNDSRGTAGTLGTGSQESSSSAAAASAEDTTWPRSPGGTDGRSSWADIVDRAEDDADVGSAAPWGDDLDFPEDEVDEETILGAVVEEQNERQDEVNKQKVLQVDQVGVEDQLQQAQQARSRRSPSQGQLHHPVAPQYSSASSSTAKLCCWGATSSAFTGLGAPTPPDRSPTDQKTDREKVALPHTKAAKRRHRRRGSQAVDQTDRPQNTLPLPLPGGATPTPSPTTTTTTSAADFKNTMPGTSFVDDEVEDLREQQALRGDQEEQQQPTPRPPEGPPPSSRSCIRRPLPWAFPAQIVHRGDKDEDVGAPAAQRTVDHRSETPKAPRGGGPPHEEEEEDEEQPPAGVDRAGAYSGEQNSLRSAGRGRGSGRAAASSSRRSTTPSSLPNDCEDTSSQSFAGTEESGPLPAGPLAAGHFRARRMGKKTSNTMSAAHRPIGAAPNIGTPATGAHRPAAAEASVRRGPSGSSGHRTAPGGEPSSRHEVFLGQWQKWPPHKVAAKIAEGPSFKKEQADATSFMLDRIPEPAMVQLRAEHVLHDLNEFGFYGLYDFVHVVIQHLDADGETRAAAMKSDPKRNAPYIFVNFVNKFAADLFRQAVESGSLHCRTFTRVRYAQKQGFLRQAAESAGFEFWAPDPARPDEEQHDAATSDPTVMTPKANANHGRWARIRNPSHVPLIFKRAPRLTAALGRARGSSFFWDVVDEEHFTRHFFQLMSAGGKMEVDEKFEFKTCIPPWRVYAFPILGQSFDRNLLRLSLDLNESMLPPPTHGSSSDEVWFEVDPPKKSRLLAYDFYQERGQNTALFAKTWWPIWGLYGKCWTLRKQTGSAFGYLLAASTEGGTTSMETLGGSFFDAALGFQKPTYLFYFIPRGVIHAALAAIVAEAPALPARAGRSEKFQVARYRAAALAREEQIADRLQKTIAATLCARAADLRVWHWLKRYRDFLFSSTHPEDPTAQELLEKKLLQQLLRPERKETPGASSNPQEQVVELQEQDPIPGNIQDNLSRGFEKASSSTATTGTSSGTATSKEVDLLRRLQQEHVREVDPCFCKTTDFSASACTGHIWEDSESEPEDGVSCLRPAARAGVSAVEDREQSLSLSCAGSSTYNAQDEISQRLPLETPESSSAGYHPNLHALLSLELVRQLPRQEELDLEEKQLHQQLQQKHHVAQQQQQQQQAYTLYCPDESFRETQMNLPPGGCCGFFAAPWRGTTDNAGAASSSSHVDWRPVGFMPGAAVFTNPLQLVYPVHQVVNPYPTTVDSLPSVPEIQHPSPGPEARGATDYGARTGTVDRVDVGVQTQPILVSRSGVFEPRRPDHESLGVELRLVAKNTFLSLEEKEKAADDDTFLSLSADGRKRRRPRSLPPSK